MKNGELDQLSKLQEIFSKNFNKEIGENITRDNVGFKNELGKSK